MKKLLVHSFLFIFLATAVSAGGWVRPNCCCSVTTSVNLTTYVVINSTNGTNNTNENITLWYFPYGNDTTSIKNITNWYMNGASIAVLNMPFEGGSNSTWTKDYSGRGNNGNVTGATWNSTGGYDGKGAYLFDGIDDYINLSSTQTLNLSSDMSMSAWLYRKSDVPAGIYFGIVSKWDLNNKRSYTMMLRDDEKFQCGISGDGGAAAQYTYCYSSDIIGLNSWSHLACSYNHLTNKSDIYVNGTKKSATCVYGASSIFTASSADVLIGAQVNATGLTRFFNGTIDDVIIFNRSLTADQILLLYQNQTDKIHFNETTA